MKGQQCVPHILGGGRAAFSFGVQHTIDVSAQRFGGTIGRIAGQRTRLFFELAQQGMHRGLGRPQPIAGDALPQHNAQGVDIGALIVVATDEQLGRDIAGGADDKPGLGEFLLLWIGAVATGQTKVENHRPQAPVGLWLEHHVGEFEVAMDHPGGMGCDQRLGDLCPDLAHALPVDLVFGLEHLHQILAVHQLHDHERTAIGHLTVLERADDMGVVQP